MVTTLIFVISLTAFSDLVVHVNKVDNIDWDIDEGSFEGGADKREVRMDGSLPGGNAESGGGKVEPAPGPTTSGECRGVLSRSFGDNESKLSMPLSFSIDMYDAVTKKNENYYFTKGYVNIKPQTTDSQYSEGSNPIPTGCCHVILKWANSALCR